MVDIEELKQKINIYNAKCKMLGIEPMELGTCSGGIVLKKAHLRDDENNCVIPRIASIIGARAFEQSKIRTIIIPESIKEIDELAFMMCEKIKTVIIEDGVKRIGESAFKYCERLEKVKYTKECENNRIRRI